MRNKKIIIWSIVLSLFLNFFVIWLTTEIYLCQKCEPEKGPCAPISCSPPKLGGFPIPLSFDYGLDYSNRYFDFYIYGHLINILLAIFINQLFWFVIVFITWLVINKLKK